MDMQGVPAMGVGDDLNYSSRGETEQDELRADPESHHLPNVAELDDMQLHARAKRCLSYLRYLGDVLNTQFISILVWRTQ